MQEQILAIATALWLGILTSISPCPLATNIAAISYIGRRVAHPRHVMATGLLYMTGRAAAYLVLGALLVTSLVSAPFISHILQKYSMKVLGPLLIIVGMFMLGLVPVRVAGPSLGEKLQGRVERMGLWGAGLLGVVFALSFCPLSAVIFFGSLVPLAVRFRSGILLPALYGVGTALPVFVFAILIALGARSLGTVFDRVTQIEIWARRITGGVFIGIGLYMSLHYIFHLFG